MWIVAMFQISPNVQLVRSWLDFALWLSLAGLLCTAMFAIGWDVMASKFAIRKKRSMLSLFFPSTLLTSYKTRSAIVVLQSQHHRNLGRELSFIPRQRDRAGRA
jgi:hypothetical protein